ncbi:unnamed protein product [Mytilus edulis]|uniref:Reverse transcriptase domain-containing protein n=1 Tax=Mytilus edulis TaxID=6550 RepID=A0A8S3Q161_MYTED|nr:unnamed protein product [Mytilus edulis]
MSSTVQNNATEPLLAGTEDNGEGNPYSTGYGSIEERPRFTRNKLEKVLEQLNDNEYYTKLRKNNDKSTIRKIKKLVEEYSESFTDNEIAYLCDFTPKEANFYGLPKIHKSNTIQTAVKHQNRKYIESPNPNDLKLRPIVAGPESTTQRMSHFLDLILKKLCPLIPSYVRDDIDFLRYIPETVTKNTLLTTFDVTSLYTNIPHDLGTTAIKYWVEINREIVDGRFDTEFIVKALKIILEGNIFYFDGLFLLPASAVDYKNWFDSITKYPLNDKMDTYNGHFRKNEFGDIPILLAHYNANS